MRIDLKQTLTRIIQIILIPDWSQTNAPIGSSYRLQKNLNRNWSKLNLPYFEKKRCWLRRHICGWTKQLHNSIDHHAKSRWLARLNLLNVLICIAKKKFDSDFPSPCFDVPKASNFTSGGVQNRETKQETGIDYDVLFRTSLRKTDFSVIFLLWANQFAKKWYNSALFIRKCRINLCCFLSVSVFHNRSQSTVLGLAVLYPTGSAILRFW